MIFYSVMSRRNPLQQINHSPRTTSHRIREESDQHYYRNLYRLSPTPRLA